MPDIHLRKQNLTKAMVFAARERMLNLFGIAETRDPIERDELMIEFIGNATSSIKARNVCLSLPLSRRERTLLELHRGD